MLCIPYARFVQAVRVAAEERQQQSQAELLNAGFIGWQVAGSIGGRKVGSFKRYATNLGLMPKSKTRPMSEEQVVAAEERTRVLAERVVQAFGKGGA